MTEESEFSERDVMRKIRTDICDAEIEIEAMEIYGVKSQMNYLANMRGRLTSLKTQFHVFKTLWK